MSILATDQDFIGSADPIGDAWRLAWTPPDRRPTRIWANTNVNLQGDYAKRGYFTTTDTRYLELPIDLFDDDRVRMINILKAVQTFGSGVADICFQRIFADRPGPYMANYQTDDDSEQHYLTRVKPTFEASPVNRSLYDRLHKKRDLYQWPHMNAYFQGANLNSLQRKSIQYQLNDEVWCWSPKMLGEAWARTSAFSRICKIFNISQGGLVDTDWHECHEAGRRYENAWRCTACNHLQPLDFFGHLKSDPGQRAGIVWADDARRSDGTWNYGRAAETTRLRCVNCAAELPDTPKTWDLVNRSQEYICLDDDRPYTNVSLHWNALVRGQYASLAEKFLRATELQKQGSTAKLEEFYQKHLARFWDPSMAIQKITLTTTDYLKENPFTPGYKAAKISEEKIRFLTADYQQGTGNEGRHLWVECRAWRVKGKGSRLLWEGRVRTFDDLRQLQLLLDVTDPATCIDGSFEMMEVAAVCARYGWTMLCGDDKETFQHAAPKSKTSRHAQPRRRPFSPRLQIDPHKGRTGAGRSFAYCFYWSNPTVKNITYRLRHGHGAPWEIPVDVSPEYRDQIDSEAKKRFVNKQTGNVEYRWVKYKTDNHHWDGECMQVVCALIAELIDFDFDEIDDAARPKHSFESSAPTIEARPITENSKTTAQLPPHNQPQQLELITA